mgnify:CR=1 FL=1
MEDNIVYRFFKSAFSLILSFVMIIFPWVSDTAESREIAAIQKNPLVLSADFTVTAHAGAMNLPDNSIAALLAAVCAGFDVVEMDLSYRPDGTPVIIHNSAPGQDEGVLLDDALAVVALNGKTKINLDNKSVANLPEVYRLILKHGLQNRVFFTGVDEYIESRLNAQCPMPYYLSCSIDRSVRDSREYAQQLAVRALAGGFTGINCDFGEISRTVVDVMHENGLFVSVWTVNENIDMVRMLALSVDNITTRNPCKLKLIIGTW